MVPAYSFDALMALADLRAQTTARRDETSSTVRVGGRHGARFSSDGDDEAAFPVATPAGPDSGSSPSLLHTHRK